MSNHLGNIGPTPSDITQRRHVVAGILLAFLFILTWSFGHFRGWSTLTDNQPQQRTISIARGIDVNTAAWWEFAQLPGLGESLSRRIVDYRDHSKEMRHFESPGDLLQVRGIGPTTLHRMAPFIRDKPSRLTAPRPTDSVR